MVYRAERREAVRQASHSSSSSKPESRQAGVPTDANSSARAPRGPATRTHEGHPRTDRAHGNGQLELGLPTHPRRTEEGRASRSKDNHRDNAEEQRHCTSPDRPTSWNAFLKSHADVIAAADFFTVDVWTKRGLVTHYVFFVIQHATRIVEIAGVTPNPGGNVMTQVARNLTDHVDGFLRHKKFLILDNDSLFAKQFCGTLEDAGVKIVRTAFQAPDMHAFAERWVQTVKRECMSKLILFGEGHLRRTLFAAHYHLDRPHQGIGNERIAPPNDEPPNGNRVVVDERLGGLLRSYRRAA